MSHFDKDLSAVATVSKGWLPAFVRISPLDNGFPVSVVSQLMSKIKVPECHQMAASRTAEIQFFDAPLRAAVRHTSGAPRSFLEPHSLDLIEADLVSGAVVELRRPRAFVRSNCLGVFQRTTVL